MNVFAYASYVEYDEVLARSDGSFYILHFFLIPCYLDLLKIPTALKIEAILAILMLMRTT